MHIVIYILVLNLVYCSTHAATRQNPSFSGSYSSIQQGSTITISLTQYRSVVTGTLMMNGQQATIKGYIKKLTCSGNIVEDETGKTYQFEAQKQAENLYFSFRVPDQQHTSVKLELQKKKVDLPIGIKMYNPLLVGTWRYTEVISSGRGQFYSSFSTDYFVKFDGNGMAWLWTGKSAGGTRNATIDGAKPGTIKQVKWYTENKTLYLVEVVNGQKSEVQLYVESRRMMLTSGQNKKVYHRIN